MKKTAILLALFTIYTSAQFAATLTVCASGCDHTSISDAIAAASPGDVIDIQDAVHTEDNIVIDKNLTIKGQGMTSTTVQAAASVAAADDGVFSVQTNLTVLFQDFTIRHGNARSGGSSGNTNGGAVYITSNTLTDVALERMCITNNRADQNGGGVYITIVSGKLHLTDCVISNNEANTSSSTSFGGGIANVGADDFKLIRCTVSGNTAGNDGGGVHVNEGGSVNQFINCTIHNNTAGFSAGAAAGGGLNLGNSASHELINCTVKFTNA